MRLLALADIHGVIKHIPLLANAAKDCDAVVMAGDVTDFGTDDQARSVLSALGAFGKPLLGVSGNCDPPHVDDMLKQQGGGLLHGPAEMNGFIFVGFSYAASQEAVFPNEPISILKTKDCGLKTAQRHLNEPILHNPGLKPMILVTHQPAWGTAVDLQASTRHKGSRSVRSFIEDHQPLLAVSGHIHEAYGTDQIGSTLLVNPGPFRNGRYATIDINRDKAVAKLHWL
ncbi:MAG: metallophosphoesterase family protein [Planctomycetota bacterium]|jgi:Icc-related predicted phosphoesterase